MQARPDTYQPIVISNADGWVVSCGTLLIERKFIRGLGSLGHVEDIVVAPSERGNGLGKLVIQQLQHLAQRSGCYKICLDCETRNEGFYEKCGFTKKGSQMAIYVTDQVAFN